MNHIQFPRTVDNVVEQEIIGKSLTMGNDGITASDVLTIIVARTQWCRENGESDMRNILNTARGIKSMIEEGKTRTELLAYFADEDEDEA